MSTQFVCFNRVVVFPPTPPPCYASLQCNPVSDHWSWTQHGEFGGKVRDWPSKNLLAQKEKRPLATTTNDWKKKYNNEYITKETSDQPEEKEGKNWLAEKK